MPEPVLSVVVPVFNEATEIEAVLRQLTATPCPIAREWLVVDDGSTDGTADILARIADELGFRLLAQEQNRGKGAAVRAGIAVATGDYLIVQDADWEYDPADIPRLLEPLMADRADVVYGSRFRRERPQVHRTFHFLINRFLTLLSNLLSGIYLSDMETCYKLFRTDLVQAMSLRSDRFGFEVEVTAYVAKAQVRVFELPISYTPRTRLAGKKISWRDGVAALWHLVYFNLLVSPERAFGARMPERYRVK
jgi:glycosyltransferase involved in cell wall biosynthesis